ncbi:hypothetical protein D3C77_725800 [compost metagenome]
MPAGGRGARFGPDVTNDQDVEDGLEHEGKRPWKKCLFYRVGAGLPRDLCCASYIESRGKSGRRTAAPTDRMLCTLSRN